MALFDGSTPLSFPLILVDETVIATLGDAKRHLADLPKVKREWAHWKLAQKLLDDALRDPDYLQAATMSFQTALLLDGDLSRPHVVDLL
jgi:hypothetical protein